MSIRTGVQGYLHSKGITSSQQASEFPEKQLVQSAGKLFAKLARRLYQKRSVVLNYIKSSKHEDSKQKLTINKARERDLAKALGKHDAETRCKEEILSELCYRVTGPELCLLSWQQGIHCQS